MQAILEKVTMPAESSWQAFVRERREFPFRWHFHVEYELTLVIESRGKRFVGDSIEDYGNGDLVLLGPNLPHTWASTPGMGRRHRAVVIQFGRDFQGAGFFESPDMREVERLLQRARQGLQFYGRTRDEAIRQVQELTKLTGLPRLLALLRILERLAQSREVRTLSLAGFTRSLPRGDEARIDRVCGYIHGHLTERLSLQQMAGLVHMSPRAFTRFFKRTLGKTLVEYVNEMRIGQACAKLIDSDQNVTEICYASGFNNLAHFNRKFLALKKCTPRQYRQNHSVKV